MYGLLGHIKMLTSLSINQTVSMLTELHFTHVLYFLISSISPTDLVPATAPSSIPLSPFSARLFARVDPSTYELKVESF